MPFRFGTTVMTGMPVLHLRVRMEDEAGRAFEGWSACGVVSMWFDKDYSKPESQREADLLHSVSKAVSSYSEAGRGSAWHLHQEAEPVARKQLQLSGLNALVAGYGVALMDAAIIDGVCRHSGASFYHGLKQGLLGFDSAITDALPHQPSPFIALRHTIGLGDPLVGSDVAKPLHDGLPHTLEQVIDQYGASYFKIKVNNDVQASMDRLHQISSVLESKGTDYSATLDGNEAFPDMESFLEFVTACASSPKLAPLWERVLYIEQPVARHSALEDSVAPALKTISNYKRVIIDESDDDDSVLHRALHLGYSGISAKNCKGVFRTLQSFLAINKAPADSGLILSSEDLTNQPILPNHQDLCVAAALGLTHSERNGHHFFRGFEFLSPAEREEALRDYPSLYKQTADGIPSLRIHNGEMCMTEINSSVGLGVISPPDLLAMEKIDFTSFRF